MPPRVKTLRVKNLRSVGDQVTLTFPSSGALVLLGENNAGKSNITRAIDILFGEQWPGSRQLEEHDFHGRDSDGLSIDISADVEDLPCPYCGESIQQLRWSYDLQSDEGPAKYSFRCTCRKTYPNKQLRSMLASTRMDTDRQLGYQLSYASKYTMLSKLMHRFHERLLADGIRRDQLTANFATLVELFRGVPEFNEFQEALVDRAEQLGQNLPYRLDVDFSAYDPSNFFRSLRVHPKLDGDVRAFDELGTGQEQILALAFAWAYAKAFGQAEGTILVIEEPEAHLHPLAQRWLASQLNTMATAGLQIVITTHSPHFVNLNHPENLVLVRKDDDGATRVVQHTPADLAGLLVATGADPARTTPTGIGPFYAAAATTEVVDGLFARRCVLVEGPTEHLALPYLLDLVGLDVLKEGVAIVPVGGIGNMAKWYRLFAAFDRPCYCVFDTDSEKTGAEARSLETKRKDLMQALGRPDGEGAIDSFPSEPLSVFTSYAVLDSNFESAVSALLGVEWDRRYDASAAVVGEASKPLRARYAASQLGPMDCDESGLTTLRSLALAIRMTGFAGAPAACIADDDPPY